MNIAIRLDNLTKRYAVFRKEPVDAVCDISLEVKQGEVFGFIGPNGAGKSTTIKMLTGLVRPTSGNARIFDMPIDNPAARLRVGYVPESPYLYDYLTPLEIMRMGMSLHRVAVTAPVLHCMSWLERLGLGGVANTRIRSFSKGMTQRVALAQAMCIQPKLLILDEPLSGLDPVGRREVVDMLAEYKADGGTIFLTSHVLHDVERLADRFGLIHKGRLLALNSPNDLVGGDRAYTVYSLGTEPYQGARQESSGRWVAEVRGEALWGTLETIKRANHILVEVKPTLTLESAFFKYLNESSRST